MPSGRGARYGGSLGAMGTVQTEVAIIGAGPAGLLLAHLLAQDGVDSVVVERRSRAYVESRVRAGILESSVVELLDNNGLGARVAEEGQAHRGIYLQWPGQRHHLDFVELVGRGVHLYGQSELQLDLGRARDVGGQVSFYGVSGTTLHDVDTDRPSVTFTDADGALVRLEARAVAGCDGKHGPSRQAIPEASRSVFERLYPFAWLGILATVPPSTDELIYAWHPDGFALHSMRSDSVSRLYLQVPVATDIAAWSDERIWDALSTRLGAGQTGWELKRGPIFDKAVLPFQSFVMTPMRHGRLFIAGDAAHTVPPTGAKGLNLAAADVALLAPALISLIREGDARLADAYSETALRRVWRSTYFSWWMTTTLHTTDDPFTSELQRTVLEMTVASRAHSTALAESYAGLPIGV